MGDGPVLLLGDRGFSFDGSAQLAALGAGFCPCVPGSTINLDAMVSGNDLQGVATLDGKSFTDLGEPNSLQSMTISIDGEMIAPPAPAFGASPTETVFAPGIFSPLAFFDHEGVRESLVGDEIRGGHAAVFRSRPLGSACVGGPASNILRRGQCDAGTIITLASRLWPGGIGG